MLAFITIIYLQIDLCIIFQVYVLFRAKNFHI